jgi:hypothetical protein
MMNTVQPDLLGKVLGASVATDGSDSGKCIALVSCVKTKVSEPTPAKDLYVSPLFRGMRRYAEANADAWFILSAEHGVLHPDQIVAPYEKTLSKMAATQRRAWADRVVTELDDALQPVPAQLLVLAGVLYRAPVVAWSARRTVPIALPLDRLPFGAQLRWLQHHAPRAYSLSQQGSSKS